VNEKTFFDRVVRALERPTPQDIVFREELLKQMRRIADALEGRLEQPLIYKVDGLLTHETLQRLQKVLRDSPQKIVFLEAEQPLAPVSLGVPLEELVESREPLAPRKSDDPERQP
jgi:hypothetical protein